MRIPFGTISITEESKALIGRILESNRVSSGKYVREFETRFADLVGAREAVAVSTGTDADALALAVLYEYGAKRGDEVIMPALSFMATANAALQAGFHPVFVDIDRHTLNIAPERIESVITEKTRAIMPVHLMGKPADMDSIQSIARKHKIFVVADAAEAHGASYRDVNVGALGDMVAYSLYVAHIISTIEGGVVTTNNPDFAEILRSLRSHGRACTCDSCVLNTASSYCPKRFRDTDGEDIRFLFERIGFSSKMNELEAAVGLGNLGVYKEILDKRRENLGYLMHNFKRFSPSLYTIEEGKNEVIGPHAFPFVLGERVRFTRNELMAFLEGKGIDTRTLFMSIPTQCKGLDFLGHKLGDFSNAEYVGRQGIHVGVHQGLGKEECDYFLETIEEFLNNHS
jgi:dTDP-4-amino-4,6-dideoxygalactose transaminase